MTLEQVATLKSHHFFGAHPETLDLPEEEQMRSTSLGRRKEKPEEQICAKAVLYIYAVYIWNMSRTERFGNAST